VLGEFHVDCSQLHNDSTSITLSGAYHAADGHERAGKPTPAAAHGHNKEHRPDLKQLVWILTVSADGAAPRGAEDQHDRQARHAHQPGARSDRPGTADRGDAAHPGGRARQRSGPASNLAADSEAGDQEPHVMGNNETIRNHAAFIWSVADLLRGDYKQSEYGKVVLPLTVIRRLDCVLEPTKQAVLEKHKQLAGKIENVEPVLQAVAGQQFYNTSPLTFTKLLDDPNTIADSLALYIGGVLGGGEGCDRQVRLRDSD
jgi:hypothetical protein